MAGAVAKDDPNDLERLRSYLNQRAARRKTSAWQDLYAARTELP